MKHVAHNKRNQLRELHLFAGAGGGILGGMLCGHRTVCAVEIEKYPREVLLQRQRDGILPEFPIWDDVQTFDGKPWRGKVDIVCGGFPCQDISAAGKGAGIEGERSSMWKHMARIIGEVRPKYAFVENSPMLVGRGLSTVLADLAEMGYDAKWGVVGAHHVSAPHRRDRIWILAYTDLHSDKREIDRVMGEKEREARENESLHSSSWNAIGASKHEWEHSVHGLEQVTKESCGDVSSSNLRGCNNGGDSERQHEANHAQVGEVTEDQQSGSVGQHRTSENGCDVADTKCKRLEGFNISKQSNRIREWPPSNAWQNSSQNDVGNAMCERQPRQGQSWFGSDPAEKGEGETDHAFSERIGHIWGIKSPLGRVANGVAARVDRLKAIGNGQVSSVAKLAWRILTNTKL